MISTSHHYDDYPRSHTESPTAQPDGLHSALHVTFSIGGLQVQYTVKMVLPHNGHDGHRAVSAALADCEEVLIKRVEYFYRQLSAEEPEEPCGDRRNPDGPPLPL